MKNQLYLFSHDSSQTQIIYGINVNKMIQVFYKDKVVMQLVLGMVEGKSALIRILTCKEKKLNEREEKNYKTSFCIKSLQHFHLLLFNYNP